MAAIRRVTGLETTTDGIPVQGMLDGDILTQMMKAPGVPRGDTKSNDCHHRIGARDL